MKKLLIIVAAFMLLTSAMPEKTTTIFVIGDSTAANKDTTGGKQERGWAMVLQEYFDNHITVDNHAVNGRSSKSFIDEGRWDKVLAKIKPGDYVIIQFGHKMNSVVRRNFVAKAPANDDDEKLRTQTFGDAPKTVEGDSLIDTHGLYRVAPRDVAKRMNCHFVDANQITHDLEQGLGPEGSKRLHMWFLPGTEPSEPKGKQDNTHYNIYGAHQVARLLADALCQEIPVLKAYRKDK